MKKQIKKQSPAPKPFAQEEALLRSLLSQGLITESEYSLACINLRTIVKKAA